MLLRPDDELDKLLAAELVVVHEIAIKGTTGDANRPPPPIFFLVENMRTPRFRQLQVLLAVPRFGVVVLVNGPIIWVLIFSGWARRVALDVVDHRTGGALGVTRHIEVLLMVIVVDSGADEAASVEQAAADHGRGVPRTEDIDVRPLPGLVEDALNHSRAGEDNLRAAGGIKVQVAVLVGEDILNGKRTAVVVPRALTISGDRGEHVVESAPHTRLEDPGAVGAKERLA